MFGNKEALIAVDIKLFNEVLAPPEPPPPPVPPPEPPDCATQLNTPAPLVLNTSPGLPPSIVTRLMLPKFVVLENVTPLPNVVAPDTFPPPNIDPDPSAPNSPPSVNNSELP